MNLKDDSSQKAITKQLICDNIESSNYQRINTDNSNSHTFGIKGYQGYPTKPIEQDDLEFEHKIKNPTEILRNKMNNNYYFKDKNDLNKIGISLYEQGKYSEAEEYYIAAIELDSNFKAAFNNLGNTLRKQKKYNKALISYKKVLELDPISKVAYNGIGNTFDYMKLFDEAIENYKKAISIDPNYKGAYNNMGKALENQKNYQDAINNYKKALDIDPNDKIARKNLKRCQAIYEVILEDK